MLGGDQDRAGGNILDAAIFQPKTADRFQKPDGNRPPEPGEGKDGSPAEQHGRQADDHQNHQVQIEERVEKQRSRCEHWGRRGLRFAACLLQRLQMAHDDLA